MSARIEAIDAEKAKTIAAADMPVTGLGFGDGCVTFDGLPLEQASDAQPEISMAIAAAMNPKLRVLRIRDGSLLDDDALARVAAWAEGRTCRSGWRSSRATAQLRCGSRMEWWLASQSWWRRSRAMSDSPSVCAPMNPASSTRCTPPAPAS